MVKLQESPDDMPPGQTPHTVIVYAHDDLVDAVQPGDRVYVTGIYRAVPMRVNPKVCLKHNITVKVHIFWVGHKILRNLRLTFDWHYIGQK